MIEGRELVLKRGGHGIVAGVSVQVAPAAVTALVGPSGAGKSSLLALLAGDLRPTSGGVSLDGRALVWYGPRGLARRRAVLPQASPLGFPFTALEVVRMGRAPHGDDATAGGDLIARRMLGLVGLSGFAERRYPTLSGGEQQRVQLARVLAQHEGSRAGERAGYLLLDEPTSSLDLGHQVRVLGLARAAAARGAGVLVVLHDLSLAARFADHVVLLAGGRVRAEGAPGEVLRPAHLDVAFGCETLTIEIDGHVAAIVPQPEGAGDMAG